MFHSWSVLTFCPPRRLRRGPLIQKDAVRDEVKGQLGAHWVDLKLRAHLELVDLPILGRLSRTSEWKKERSKWKVSGDVEWAISESFEEAPLLVLLTCLSLCSSHYDDRAEMTIWGVLLVVEVKEKCWSSHAIVLSLKVLENLAFSKPFLIFNKKVRIYEWILNVWEPILQGVKFTEEWERLPTEFPSRTCSSFPSLYPLRSPSILRSPSLALLSS